MDFEKHFHKRTSELEIRDNYQPIILSCEEEWFDDMPIVRSNYLELQNEYNILLTKMASYQNLTPAEMQLYERLTSH